MVSRFLFGFCLFDFG